jgi:serine/threonine protein phosphatase Stp1
MTDRLLSRGVTHRGTVRTRNEDAFVDRGDIGLWAVADGAGGHGAGDVASAAVATALQELPPDLTGAEMLTQVRTRMAAVHGDLQRRAAEAGPGRVIATTIVILLARDGHFACLWAGDSRAYLLRGGVLCQLTRDHSLVQDMVDAGLLLPEEAERHPQANVITRAVGGEGELDLDKVSARIEVGDTFLLCSDGLFKALAEDDMAERLAAQDGPDALIEAALARGAGDNVTALVVGPVG